MSDLQQDFNKMSLFIEELAETVKELVRIITCFPNAEKLPEHLKKRLNDVYTKASKSKDRIT